MTVITIKCWSLVDVDRYRGTLVSHIEASRSHESSYRVGVFFWKRVLKIQPDVLAEPQNQTVFETVFLRICFCGFIFNISPDMIIYHIIFENISPE